MSTKERLKGKGEKRKAYWNLFTNRKAIERGKNKGDIQDRWSGGKSRKKKPLRTFSALERGIKLRHSGVDKGGVLLRRKGGEAKTLPTFCGFDLETPWETKMWERTKNTRKRKEERPQKKTRGGEFRGYKVTWHGLNNAAGWSMGGRFRKR